MWTVAVRPEDGAEDAKLKPAQIKLLIRRIGRLSVIGVPVAADIGCPIRHAGERIIHAHGYLMRYPPEAAEHIAGPYRRVHSLLTQEGRSCQQKIAFLFGCLSPV